MRQNFKTTFRTAAIAALGVIGIAGSAEARAPENAGDKQMLLKSAAGCTPANAAIDLDINNVRARIMTSGNMWYDRGTGEARYEIPKGSRKNSLYAGSLWVGGYDTQGQLKVTAQTYMSGGRNDYWSGPLDRNNNVTPEVCNLWDRFWKVNKTDVIRFRDIIRQVGTANPASLEDALSDPIFDAIKEWPGKGSFSAKGTNDQPISDELFLSSTREYAPFVDVNGDGRYNYLDGDYPDILGDQYIWRVFNDMGNSKTQTGTLGIGLEVQASAFAFSTKDYLNDATFYNYRLINRGNLTLDSCYTATWTDADLGFANDDYIGSDTARGLGILYNAKAVDGTGQVNAYGTQVPMVGVDFFIGPRKFFKDSLGRDTSMLLKMSNFTYFTQGGGSTVEIQDPSNGLEFYRYMTGSNRYGQPFTNDFSGRCGDGNKSKGYGRGPISRTIYTGDPSVPNTWSECCSGNDPGDRRFVHSAGPFRLTGGGVTNDITIGACWVANVGGCPTTNFSRIKLADDAIQELFDNQFRLIEGPEAPRVTKREMDRKIIMYLTNDSNSNNFQEKFGYDLSEQRYRVSTAKTRQYGNGDSLWRFEGYRIFQLRDRTVQPSDIFGEDGKVNAELAAEVFQTDIKNGVTDLVNNTPNNDVSGGAAFSAVTKVRGSDNGIQHSFVITQDAFARGNDKTLVNYKTYYFVAVAYAYNNFNRFESSNLEKTQDRQYLESAKGQGGIPIPVISAMPNPAYGDMGTAINSDYGSGVKITRIEGTGNGGNAVQMTPASEQEALTSPLNQVARPEYVENAGPVNVKVIDPVLLKEAEWELSITGPLYTGDSAYRGIRAETGSWKLTMNDGSTPVTIYSERNLTVANEQILSQYGLSVSVRQVDAPGDNEADNNGYITSDVSFADPAKTWLTGVPDAGVEGANYLNWVRAGSFGSTETGSTLDNVKDWYPYDKNKVYERMLGNNSGTLGTWAPFMLTANRDSLLHSMMPSTINGPTPLDPTRPTRVSVPLYLLPGVDVVFTSDKSKWSKCVVVETESDAGFAEGGAAKFTLRRHAGWNKDDVNANGDPIYRDSAGVSWFPGYAINVETGVRLNIFFGEDSYLKSDNGADMLFNPTSNMFTQFGTPLFGGKHFVWVTNSRYDGCDSIYRALRTSTSVATINSVYRQAVWAGMPMSLPNTMLRAGQGLIPTETRLRFRVNRPYNTYIPEGQTPVAGNNGYPLYRFKTTGMGAKTLSDASNNTVKDGLLEKIAVVPNPYYAYAEHYEQNRLDSRVRIINLPRKAEISIYSIDGALVRRLTKDDANTAYLDWDLRNAKGLPVASGMYLMHVKADGIGETILRFFGALRPLDVTNY